MIYTLRISIDILQYTNNFIYKKERILSIRRKEKSPNWKIRKTNTQHFNLCRNRMTFYEPIDGRLSYNC